MKDLAKSENLNEQALAIKVLNEHQFEVKATGAGYFPYVLQDNAYRISLSGIKAQQLPLAQVQIRSGWLLKYGVEHACQDLLPIIEYFGDLDDQAQVSRADLYVDFMTTLPIDALQVGQWVSRALYIGNHTLSREITGYSIGRGGDISCRLYDKTKEIEKSGKDYMKALWYQQGWEPGITVWRLEFQYLRRILKEHGVQSVPELLERLGPLWRYSTLSWLKLTIPSQTDKTQSRWPLHPVWAALAALEWAGSSTAPSVPVRSTHPPTEHFMFVNGMSGYTSYLAANDSRHSDEMHTNYYRDAKDYHDRNSFHTGADFARYVNEKAAIKAKKANLPFPDIEQQTQQRIRDALKTDPDAYRKSKDGE